MSTKSMLTSTNKYVNINKSALIAHICRNMSQCSLTSTGYLSISTKWMNCNELDELTVWTVVYLMGMKLDMASLTTIHGHVTF